MSKKTGVKALRTARAVAATAPAPLGSALAPGRQAVFEPPLADADQDFRCVLASVIWTV